MPKTKDNEPASASGDSSSSEAHPAQFGRYLVTAKVGSGGFGTVYKGHDPVLDRDVAIKVAHSHCVVTPKDAEAYLTEGRVLAGLDHPGIVAVHDVGCTEDGLYYLVSKFVAGSDLAHRLREERLTAAEAVELVAHVAEALDHAHRRGLVHRDIKPGNILLDENGNPVVADFGLALREQDFGTGPGGGGTPAYMSPEQARGEGHRVDARSDVYSLGVVLYELLTGRRPFPATDFVVLIDQIITQEPRPPRQLDPTIARELDRICLKALSKRAADRYSTALDLAEDLRLWLTGQAARPESLPALVPPPTSAPPPPTVPAAVSAPPAQDSEKGPVRVVPRGLRSFESGDADFFLDLLPGPRNRQGLPDSISFWKTRLEATDADQTFTVGLMYGPSGCGKSSLVKAGLLPRLANHVVTVYVEATPDETEAGLLKSLRKRCPNLHASWSLEETIANLRRGRGLPAGKKVVLVLDQFERWLHTGADDANAELVRALRQCDGEHVQAVVMVRDDFWMAVSGFMHDLEVPLVEGRNVARVDLFDPRHARKVLSAFGRAFGALPEGDLTTDQEQFLDQAVEGLAENGKVISVRLALFADMVKGKPWTPVTLKAVGGTEGIGVTFLEETFSASTASPEHRFHQKAARAVLKALLPPGGTDIKGHVRSREELLAASGYAKRPGKFTDLLRILDAELRLITPVDPEGDLADDSEEPADANVDKSAAGPEPEKPSSGCFQLTHDYLVPSLRQWLTRKQAETRKGRAELRLAERTALWLPKRQMGHLPSFGEWITIRLFTRKRQWTLGQRKMMRAAFRYHAARSYLSLSLFALLAAGMGLGGIEFWGYISTWFIVQANIDSDVGRIKSEAPVLASRRRWATPILKKIIERDSSLERRGRACLMLLEADPEQGTEIISHHLVDVELSELALFRDILIKTGKFNPSFLWNELEDANSSDERRLRAAAVLMSFSHSYRGTWVDKRWIQACFSDTPR